MFLGLAGLLILAAATPAEAHLPPPLTFSISVDAEEVTWRLSLNAAVYEEWLPFEARALIDAEEAEQAGAKAAVAALFAESGRLTIDGIPVQPVVRKLEFVQFQDHMVDWEYVGITLAFSTKGKPRQVTFTWRNYDGGLGGYFDRVESEIDGFGEMSYYVFREREPEYTYHVPHARRASAGPRLPRDDGPTLFVIPVLSWGILLLLLVGVPLLGVFRVGRGPSWLVVSVGLTLAITLSGAARTEIVSPWAARFQRPAEAEAKDILEVLLRNVYRAFDHQTEDLVYATLDESVRGDLLTDIYLEVYQGLVLEDQGGAICRIQKVDLVEQQIYFPDDENTPRFDSRCRWRVTGRVDHANHWHIRVNEYEAVFTVTSLEGRWKIARMRVLARERVADE